MVKALIAVALCVAVIASTSVSALSIDRLHMKHRGADTTQCLSANGHCIPQNSCNVKTSHIVHNLCGSGSNYCCVTTAAAPAAVTPAPVVPTPAPASTGSWTSMGTGVTYLSGGTPCRVAIFYGGYGYTQSDSQIWVQAVGAAAGFGTQYNIHDMIAIKGPADSGYNGHEISNSKIVSYLKGLTQCSLTGPTPLTLFVVDHSSGGFVVAEWMGQMASSFPQALARTVLYDLDGAAPPSSAAKLLFRFFPTSTIKLDGTLTAMNYGSVHGLCGSFGLPASQCRFIDVAGADNSGCISVSKTQKAVGSWCLHMFMINQRPHSQSLAGGVYLQDLRDISAAHPIQINWIDQTRADLALLFGNGTPH